VVLHLDLLELVVVQVRMVLVLVELPVVLVLVELLVLDLTEHQGLMELLV